MSGHGHVVPNVDGLKARCGGPAICSVCARELHAFKDSEIERLRARVAELEVQLEQSRSLGKLGGYLCAPEHTWTEWLADRNKRVAELEAAQEWRPIESAPKDGAAFLAVDARSQSHRVVWFDDEAKLPFVWHVDDASGWFNHHADFFTHWLPLPAPPKEVT